MDRFARVVLGYHGTKTEQGVDFSRGLLDGRYEVGEWRPSENDHDWLGDGIYFWEHSPDRAKRWAGQEGFVIGAVIQLGRCLDLTDLRYTELLADAYDDLKMTYEGEGKPLPTNVGKELKLRRLDCAVINHLVKTVESKTEVDRLEEARRFQTVRCPFEEGGEAFPGSMLRRETHIQIAVRAPACILGIFRPT